MQNDICEISSQTIEKDIKGFTCKKCGSIYIYPPVNMLLPHVDIDLYPFRNTQFKTFYHVTLQLAIITRHLSTAIKGFSYFWNVTLQLAIITRHLSTAIKGFSYFWIVTLQLAIITRHVVSGKVVGPFLAAMSINSPSGCCPVRLTKTDARWSPIPTPPPPQNTVVLNHVFSKRTSFTFQEEPFCSILDTR